MSDKFTAYDSATGEVLYSGTASDPMVLQGNGVSILFDEVHESGWISNGRHNALPSRPSKDHAFDYAQKRWRDPRTLADRKLKKWQQIKNARRAAIEAPLVTPHGTFDAGEKDRANITGAILMLQTLAAMGTPETIDFTLADDTTVTLTMAQMVAVGLLLGRQVQAAYTTGRALRASIQAANNAAQLEAIEWPSA